jgi:hypothetical protein
VVNLFVSYQTLRVAVFLAKTELEKIKAFNQEMEKMNAYFNPAKNVVTTIDVSTIN